MENSSRLYRSVRDKMIGGVCGGLANYFNVDIALIRIAFVLLLIFGGGGFLAYIILWIVIPAEPVGFTRTVNTGVGQDTEDKNNVSNPGDSNERKKNNTSLIAGIVLILIGLIILFDRVFPFYDIIDFWPLVLIILGVMMIKPEILRSSNTESNTAEQIYSTDAKTENDSNK
ncbi:MAG: stress-responsive transcriptional regulator [Marinilabiliales bacterium]|nr:MAG: stress-responsive transcriptional regulator [Marinilabiliales bacterium]